MCSKNHLSSFLWRCWQGTPQPLPFGWAQNHIGEVNRTKHALSKPRATSSTKKNNPLLSQERGFEFETSIMEVPIQTTWATPKGVKAISLQKINYFIGNINLKRSRWALSFKFSRDDQTILFLFFNLMVSSNIQLSTCKIYEDILLKKIHKGITGEYVKPIESIEIYILGGHTQVSSR